LDDFIMAYLDNIIIYLNSEEEYYRYHPGGTAIAISSSGSWFIRVLPYLLKEKERGSKGRAIYRAVGG
jgi:hypothetical protein